MADSKLWAAAYEVYKREQLYFAGKRNWNTKVKTTKNRTVYTGRKYIKRQKNLTLYVLKLEDNCWYVGITTNIDRRFRQHLKGEGARWTAFHKPIKIWETEDLGNSPQPIANRLEDQKTLKYAAIYGTDFVRGGGYSQMKPRWKAVLN